MCETTVFCLVCFGLACVCVCVCVCDFFSSGVSSSCSLLPHADLLALQLVLHTKFLVSDMWIHYVLLQADPAPS